MSLFWCWLIIAFVLGILELLTGTFYLISVAVMAALVAILAVIFPNIPISLQLIIFASSSLLGMIGWAIYLKHNPSKSSDPSLNQRVMSLIGQEIWLEKSIVNGKGTADVMGSIWRIKGPDLPAGTKVKVVAVKNMELLVKRVTKPEYPGQG